MIGASGLCGLIDKQMHWILSRASIALLLVTSGAVVGLAHAAPPTLVAHGESITEGYSLSDPATEAYPALLQKALNANGKSVSVINAGNSGAGFAHAGFRGSTLSGEAPSIVDTHAAPHAALILLAGSNEIFIGKTGAETYGLFEAYISARLSAGWLPGNIIVCTILPRERLSESERSIYNSSIVSRQSEYGYLLGRLDQDPNAGWWSSYENATYYNRDRVHPNAAGHQVIERVIYPVLLSILPRLESAATRVR
jgi:acyl-CoA thioesterase-1